MARIFMDGFESGDFKLWSSSSGSVSTPPSSGLPGAYCLNLNGNLYATAIFLSSKSELYFAFKYYAANTSSAAIIQFYDSGATPILTINRNGTTKFLQVKLGNIHGSILATGTIPLSETTPFLVEIRYNPLNSGGVITTKINGIQDINYSGDTTNGLENINYFTFGYVVTANDSLCSAYFDDVIVDNANWIGPSSIQGLAVTGAGATTQFDPSTGNNYACVDEIPPSDADYISTNTPNEIDTYACGNLTGTINSVKAVQVQARCMQEGSPAVPKIQLVTRPSSTDRVSASKDVQTFQPGVASNIWELNPDDSAAWEAADVNGMEIGVKAVAS